MLTKSRLIYNPVARPAVRLSANREQHLLRNSLEMSVLRTLAGQMSALLFNLANLTRFLPLSYRFTSPFCFRVSSCLILQLKLMEYPTAQNSVAEALPTILVVEDFDDTRLMMRMWLARNGYRVIEAETGEEAIDVAKRELPDLIIMDMMMPGMNGLDATQRIREYQALRQTPIVAVSAYGANEYRSLAIEAGCNEYVSTPFDPNELAELIRDLITKNESSAFNSLPSDLEH
jgi:CheY-like chemotaxis protein